MNNLPEQMAKAHYEKKFKSIAGGFNFCPWELLPATETKPMVERMKAALEILKNPPEEFLEAMLSMDDQMADRRASVGSNIGTRDMRAILQAAINQTLNNEERWSDKDNKGFDFPTSGTQ